EPGRRGVPGLGARRRTDNRAHAHRQRDHRGSRRDDHDGAGADRRARGPGARGARGERGEMSADEALLAAMVDALVQKRIIRSAEVEAAFRAVPRHLFLPGFASKEVYKGGAIPTRRDAQGNPTSSSSEPGVMAVMLEQLGPEAVQRWLEVGAGGGGQAALTAEMDGRRGGGRPVR